MEEVEPEHNHSGGNLRCSFNGSLACIFQYTWDVNVVEVVLPINVHGVEIKHPSLSVILSHCHSQPFQVEIIKASERRSSLEINTDY